MGIFFLLFVVLFRDSFRILVSFEIGIETTLIIRRKKRSNRWHANPMQIGAIRQAKDDTHEEYPANCARAPGSDLKRGVSCCDVSNRVVRSRVSRPRCLSGFLLSSKLDLVLDGVAIDSVCLLSCDVAL